MLLQPAPVASPWPPRGRSYPRVKAQGEGGVLKEEKGSEEPAGWMLCCWHAAGRAGVGRELQHMPTGPGQAEGWIAAPRQLYLGRHICCTAESSRAWRRGTPSTAQPALQSSPGSSPSQPSRQLGCWDPWPRRSPWRLGPRCKRKQAPRQPAAAMPAGPSPPPLQLHR